MNSSMGHDLGIYFLVTWACLTLAPDGQGTPPIAPVLNVTRSAGRVERWLSERHPDWLMHPALSESGARKLTAVERC